jgi:hypothetical protein
VEFLGPFRYKIMITSNSNSFTPSFPICIPLISTSYHIVLARNSRTMLNKNGESGHPCLIPNIRGNGFSFSPYSMILAIIYSFLLC